MLMLAFIVLLNVGIAWWNCYAVGSAWPSVSRVGTRFEKALLWSGAIQSVAGFSVFIVLALAGIYTNIGSHTPEYNQMIWQAVMNLWYVAIIIPVVGSGFIVWGHSVKMAIERRDFSSIATAGYNTFAQIHNTVSLFQNLGPALKSMTKDKNGAPLAAIIIVILALCSSILLTTYLIQMYANRARLAERALG